MRPLNLAICGFGSAGRSRLRAAEENDKIHVQGIISQRKDVGNISWSDALAHPNIDAIAISTENTRHAQLVVQSLEAGKHVLCDYPLCFSAVEAHKLFVLAQSKNKVLHVEHIGLLSKAHKKAAQDLNNLGVLVSGKYEFTGGWSHALADTSRHGPPAFWAVSRLMQCADWFGPFKITKHQVVHDAENCVIELQLLFNQGGQLQFIERRASGLTRGRSFKAQLSAGIYDWDPTLENEGLFALDLNHFYDRITKGTSCYYDEAVMVSVIKELEMISV